MTLRGSARSTTGRRPTPCVKTGITDVYASAVTGDVGTSPITGAALLLSCGEVTGRMFVVDAAGPACPINDATTLTASVLDMETAYLDAEGQFTRPLSFIPRSPPVGRGHVPRASASLTADNPCRENSAFQRETSPHAFRERPDIVRASLK